MNEIKVPVLWLGDVVRLGKRGKRYMSLGYCGKTKKVAFIMIQDPNAPITMEGTKILVVRDIYVNEDCGDAEWCWNSECSLNKASLKALGKYVGKKGTMEDLKRWLRELRK